MRDEYTTFIGMDVHKDSIAIAVAEQGREAPRFIGTTGPLVEDVRKVLSHFGPCGRILLTYEAGPCGFGLARQLRKRGYECQIAAVTKIPRRSGDRIKTDRRDALMLASFLRAGELTPIVIPDERDEAIRDLCRAREDAVSARLKARHRLKAMLLRHGYRYPGKGGWTATYDRFLARVSFGHPAQDIAFAEYRNAVVEAFKQVDRLTEALRDQISTWR